MSALVRAFPVLEAKATVRDREGQLTNRGDHSRSEPPAVPLLLTIRDAARVLAVGRTTMYELIAAGAVEVVHIGRSARVPVAALEAFVARQRRGTLAVSSSTAALQPSDGAQHARGACPSASRGASSVAHVKKRETSGGVRYDVRYRGTDGTEHSKTFRTRRDADRFAATVETDKLRGSWVDPKGARITLEEYATSWLATRNGLRPRTRETYESQLHLHVRPELGALRLNALTPQRIREWHHGLVTSHAVSPNTAAKCYRLLRTILNTAVADELLARNPCQVEHGGVEHAEERPTATVSQVWQLADAMPPRLRTMLLLAGF